ncbi:hypothetical protein [Xylanimonas protaetiae]|uniref:Type IV toxin-antitoxin system AbiEi family antitoxin domain-containing protein n=1 Tax=Xylanimonas protaetiae TaxID=2509457 RepID=A0A4P6FIE8_9MICO|nr:hypothetical protein [Xylanimonas protaetiae]QAY70338.1 hypothetical protein ET471_10095 [Xylanimonas protaetiae]
MERADGLVLAAEHHPNLLRSRVRRGELERLRRGAYLPTDTIAADRHVAARVRAVARIRAVHARLDAPHVFSHTSAALLWDLPLWEPDPRVHVVQGYRAGGSAADDVARHRAVLDRWVELDGLPVTDLVRTVADCLLALHPLHGLVILDAALRQGVDRRSVRDAVLAQRRRNGKARAQVLIELGDAGAESAWETWLRYVALRLGLPRPVTQFPIATRSGTYRSDLAWPRDRVLAEFDGRVKYTADGLGAGWDPDRYRFDEKRRDDVIAETLGVRPLRFVAADARTLAAVESRLLAAFPTSTRRAARRNPLLPPP